MPWKTLWDQDLHSLGLEDLSWVVFITPTALGLDSTAHTPRDAYYLSFK